MKINFIKNHYDQMYYIQKIYDVQIAIHTNIYGSNHKMYCDRQKLAGG